jgi:hypothetical protein
MCRRVCCCLGMVSYVLNFVPIRGEGPIEAGMPKPQDHQRDPRHTYQRYLQLPPTRHPRLHPISSPSPRSLRLQPSLLPLL